MVWKKQRLCLQCKERHPATMHARFCLECNAARIAPATHPEALRCLKCGENPRLKNRSICQQCRAKGALTGRGKGRPPRPGGGYVSAAVPMSSERYGVTLATAAALDDAGSRDERNRRILIYQQQLAATGHLDFRDPRLYAA